MNDFYIREATLDDKEAVLGIDDNVYEGSDYLPVYYEHFIGAPNITPFVLLQKENIVRCMDASRFYRPFQRYLSHFWTMESSTKMLCAMEPCFQLKIFLTPAGNEPRAPRSASQRLTR